MVILVTGLKRSGKDTVANYFSSHYGFERYAFADPIKKACKEIFLLNESQIDGDKKETLDPRWGVSPREIYQILGTELLREDFCKHHEGYKTTVGTDLWAKRFVNLYDPCTNYVISDWRFPNEESVVKANIEDVVTIRVTRASCMEDGHSSEAFASSMCVDYEIENNGNIPELWGKCHSVLRTLYNTPELSKVRL